jgi:8-amino-7-oxononanoate synthase
VKSFNDELHSRTQALRDQQLYREVRRVDSAQGRTIEIDGVEYLNFSSNDYLGLANDPGLKAAAAEAVQRFGAGSGSARLIAGSLAPHHVLEEKLAAFKNLEAALVFSSGYAAAVGTICALLGPNDIVVLDKLVHASIIDGARLSGAKMRVFDHNDVDDLAKKLQWASEQEGRNLFVTESIFSMDGDRAPLREIVELKQRFGAWLMVDEAHGTGVYGQNGRGVAEECGVSGQIEIHMGTLGKALGSAGGYICGSRALVDYLINRARSFVFSTAPVPSASAAASAALDIVQSLRGAELRKIVWQRIEQLCSTKTNLSTRGAIVPVMIGDEARAIEVAQQLRKRGIFVPAVRYPTVARGQARLRVTLSAAHSSEDVATLISALE